jgi:katanin p60 ATPase-containing subunit A1
MPIDLSASYHDQYQRALRRAEKALAAGDGQSAASHYHHAASFIEKYAAYVSDGKIQSSLKARGVQLRQLAEQAAGGQLASGPALDVISVATPDGAEGDDLRQHVLALIQRSSVTWEDIAGLEGTKREIKTAYALTMARQPDGVKLTAPRTMLLYGPPGTGKTLLAAATSNGLDATFFSVKVSDVLSKYFGESTKLVDTLYAVAREHSPAVIFLDEFDAITRARGEGSESGAERRLLSTLLAELDGLNTKDDPAFVLTIAATNRPWDVDSAVRSRFSRQVYVPLPDEAARRRILEIQLEERGHETRVSYEKLVARTAGYSGREIAQMCEQAVAHMVARVNPGLVDVVDRGREAVVDYQIEVEPVKAEDFDAAFAAVGDPETTEVDLQRFARWEKEA